ncbi:uncharacterized protein LOC134834843 [Culicoides brevitarsis]|uniref:uncharacterized protein LOC134834843 n=1 Tax=Culicoides brevitarsis TaxID=469753 RepID=UPI00307C03C0
MDSDTYDDYSIEFDEDDDNFEPEIEHNDSDEAPKKQETTEKRTKKTSTDNKKLICRICLKRCSQQSKDCSEFAEIYLKCTGFSFEKDQAPTKLCFPCMNELLKVENFIEKCSETEAKLSKGLGTKALDDSDAGNISEVSDFDVVFEGEDDSDGSNFSDTVKPSPVKRGRPRIERPPKPPVDPNAPRVERRGRPPLSPSHRKPILPKGPRGRPKGSFKVKNDDEEPKVAKPKRPKTETGVKREDKDPDELQICFVCGKSVRRKQLPHHLWKHRKDEEQGKDVKSEGERHTCEFCQTNYKTEDALKGHMKRTHPAVIFGMPSRDSPEPPEEDDNFDREFHVPTPGTMKEYPPIQSPYDHQQALYYLQKGVKR